jgi:hypothetical protein
MEGRIKCPKEIQVGPWRYQVKRSIIPDSNSAWGETDFHNREIRISTATPDRQLAVTLLHEILHAVYQDRQLPEPPKRSDDESGCALSPLSHGLAQALQDAKLWPQGMELE